MTMYLVFEEMPFFVVSSMISRGNCAVMRDLLFFFACTMSLGSFPTSTHILCVVGYVQYTTNATHDGDMLWCITAGTTH